MKELHDCHYCGGELTWHWKQPRYDRCRKCGLIVRNPFPDQEELNVLYQKAWKTPGAKMYEMGVTDDDLSYQYVNQLLSTIGAEDFSGKRILEFGAGKGSMMKELLSRNANVIGIEPFGCDFLNSQGFEVFPSLDDVLSQEKFDGIISMEVFEHLREPWKELGMLFKLLKPGGWILVSTPNPRGFNALLNSDKWEQAHYSGHVVFGCEKTIIKMLREIGFKNSCSASWRIKYANSMPKMVLHNLLQFTGFDGAARVVGWR